MAKRDRDRDRDRDRERDRERESADNNGRTARIMRDFSIPQGRGGGPGVTAKGLYPEISRTKVARLLGCDPSTVTGYLAGRTKMPLERAIRFAKLAGIPVETLQRDLSRAQSEFGSK